MYCTTSINLGWEPWRKQALKLRDLLPWGSLNHAKSMADSHDFKGQLHHQLYIKRAAKQDLLYTCTAHCHLLDIPPSVSVGQVR